MARKAKQASKKVAAKRGRPPGVKAKRQAKADLEAPAKRRGRKPGVKNKAKAEASQAGVEATNTTPAKRHCDCGQCAPCITANDLRTRAEMHEAVAEISDTADLCGFCVIALTSAGRSISTAMGCKGNQIWPRLAYEMGKLQLSAMANSLAKSKCTETAGT